MKTLDFFEDLGTAFDFIPISNLQIESTVNEIVSSTVELENQSDKLETRVFSIEKDIGTISELGLKLENENARKKLQELAEDFMMENEINDLRVKLSELYGARQSIAKSLEKLSVIEDNLNLTCGVCLERTVTMFNEGCGHTMCIYCANKMDRCPFCRERARFKRMVFSC